MLRRGWMIGTSVAIVAMTVTAMLGCSEVSPESATATKVVERTAWAEDHQNRMEATQTAVVSATQRSLVVTSDNVEKSFHSQFNIGAIGVLPLSMINPISDEKLIGETSAAYARRIYVYFALAKEFERQAYQATVKDVPKIEACLIKYDEGYLYRIERGNWDTDIPIDKLKTWIQCLKVASSVRWEYVW